MKFSVAPLSIRAVSLVCVHMLKKGAGNLRLQILLMYKGANFVLAQGLTIILKLLKNPDHPQASYCQQV
jgi:hypothetical protein